jgi:hypothetical protein
LSTFVGRPLRQLLGLRKVGRCSGACPDPFQPDGERPGDFPRSYIPFSTGVSPRTRPPCFLDAVSLISGPTLFHSPSRLLSTHDPSSLSTDNGPIDQQIDRREEYRQITGITFHNLSLPPNQRSVPLSDTILDGELVIDIDTITQEVSALL